MSSPDPNLPPVLSPDDHHRHQVYVITPMRRRWWLHALLFLATVFTTLVMGARLQYNFINQLPPFRFDYDLFPIRWALSAPRNLLLGIPFSVTLLTILLAHEMGHFLYCLRYRVYATLPFFIPAPTLIGTFGAFIRIKSPIPTRRALFDIGIAGPIAGFVVAVPAAVLGLLLSKHAAGSVGESDLAFGYPLIFHALHAVLPWPVTGAMAASLGDLYMHPIAVAAWVGMLATALNLLPGGQLDGGHIVYALAPQLHRRITRALTVLLVPCAIFFWQGWFVWALFLFFLGARHPHVELHPALDGKRRLLAAIALLMLVLTLVPAPFAGGSAFDAWDAYTHDR
jgi:membrane-associated protease RseP (regulator of RpoE activity)